VSGAPRDREPLWNSEGVILAHDQTLVQIRERSFLDVLDLALVVVRRHPIALGLAALAGIAPFAALNAWLLAQPDLPIAEYPFYLLFEAPWATAFLTLVLGDLMFGRRPSAGRVLRIWIRSLPVMLVYQGVVRGFLILTVIFSPLLPLRLAFLNEVILLERGHWRKVLPRGSILCRNREGEFLGQWLAQLFFGLMFALAFWLGAQTLFRELTETEVTWEQPAWIELRRPLFQLGVWIAVAFFGVARFFSYIDQRTRLEGWEVSLRLKTVASELEEARRW
jgi:hypothetical protein